MATISPSRLAALGALLALAGCNDGTTLANRSLAPIPSETLALMNEAGVDREAPTLIRAFKKEAEFEVWKMRPDGTYVHLKTYPMCRWSGQLGPKEREGDRQVPEGFYSIAPGQLNPNSNYYLSFNVGYPNAYDRAHNRTGGTIMVHGACSSAGCFSMTDRQIAEIYAIARTSLNAGQSAVQMQSYPFRMTPENLAKHRLDPNIAFWRELKEGNDYFETTKKEPKVAVCGKRYVFGAQNQRLDAEAPCPALKRDPAEARLVAEKAARDDAKIAELAANGVKPVRLVYRDGGQHPSFMGQVAEVGRPDLIVPPTEIALEERAPRAPEAAKTKTRIAAVGKPPTEPTTRVAAAAAAGTGADWMSLHHDADAASRPAAASAKDAGKKAREAAKKIKIGSLSHVLKEAPATKGGADTVTSRN
ncbi:MAG TPA: murein L,D-transpeptidase family protein [Methylocystis sp.]|nr:murein L,D-transpeptidase family protein [Methylocystis sp.]